MRIIKDKEPIFEVDKYDVVLVGTSVYGILTNGFQGKMANRYPYIVDENLKQPYGDLRRLGTRITITKEGYPTISLLYISGYPKKGLHSLDYEALDKCLKTAAMEFKGERIITTVLGDTQFDGEGNRRRILNMIDRAFEGMDIDVYDYPQFNLKKEKAKLIEELKKQGISDSRERTEILKKQFLI